MELSEAREYLGKYSGRKLRLMEICGTHTAGIRKNGIPSLLSDRIKLVTGPGCPVCVTVTGYIDKLIALSEDPRNVIVSFGDLLRVPGSSKSLLQAKAEGADVRYVYSPMDMLKLAAEENDRCFIFGATGFETTIPVYAALLSGAKAEGIKNIRILTSLKLMPQAVRRVSGGIDGFIAPGHVAVITGAEEYKKLAVELEIPFVISGFRGDELLSAIYALVRMAEKGRVDCLNLYPQAVMEKGNIKAVQAAENFFETGDAAWRGMGLIPDSGMYLKESFLEYDAGSRSLTEDSVPPGCRCPEVITGRLPADRCPLFGKTCTPEHPVGACMVSPEGACFNQYNE